MIHRIDYSADTTLFFFLNAIYSDFSAITWPDSHRFGGRQWPVMSFWRVRCQGLDGGFIWNDIDTHTIFNLSRFKNHHFHKWETFLQNKLGLKNFHIIYIIFTLFRSNNISRSGSDTEMRRVMVGGGGVPLSAGIGGAAQATGLGVVLLFSTPKSLANRVVSLDFLCSY